MRHMVTLTLGRYRAEKLLNDSGALAAYLATDGDREVVLHVAREPGLCLDEERFTRGVAALKQLPPDLPIARVHDGGTAQSVFWTATEYPRGTTWAALYDMEMAPPGPLLMTQQVIEMVSALERAHRIGLIHGGFGPQSVTMVGDGRLRLTDFGLAPLFGAAMPHDPRYRAPEHYRSPIALDPRTDVHGVGLALFQLVTLRVPYRGFEAGLLRECALSGSPCPDSARIPPCLREIILRATSRDPARRFASMTELRAALTVASHELAVAALADVELLDVESGEREVSKTDPSETAPTSPDTLRSFQLVAVPPWRAPTPAQGPDATAELGPGLPPSAGNATAPGGPEPAVQPSARAAPPTAAAPAHALERAGALRRRIAVPVWLAAALGLVTLAALLRDAPVPAPAVIVVHTSASLPAPPEATRPAPVPQSTPPPDPVSPVAARRAAPRPAPVPRRGVAPPSTPSHSAPAAPAPSSQPRKLSWESDDPCTISWFNCRRQFR